MTQVIYDGTMAGVLTAIFEVYDRRLDIVNISQGKELQQDAFAQRLEVVTDALKARRVWKGLLKKLPATTLDQFYYSFLSENEDIENLMLAYARYVFSSDKNVSEDFGNNAVLAIVQTARKVWREKHRMEAFIRFQLLKDGLFYAAAEPDYNVLPIIIRHFRSRYADQDWLIYDARRRYGIHHQKNNHSVTEVRIDWSEEVRENSEAAYEPHEPLYQMLWKDYFHATGIPARNNKKLHLQHMPVRYWKYLTEKQY
jgi:probable DNA metabolism protein